MFGSEVIEVVIGLVFVYLLLSLIVTAVTELISGWLRWRSKHLWMGITNLVGSEEFARQLYNHPWIKGLSRSKPAEKVRILGRVWSFFKRIFSPKAPGPSYIPTKQFARALLDMVDPATVNVTVETIRDRLLTAVTSVADGAAISNLKTAVEDAITSIKEDKRQSVLVGDEIFELLSPNSSQVVTTYARKVLEELIAQNTWLAKPGDPMVAGIRAELLAAVKRVPDTANLDDLDQALEKAIDSVMADAQKGAVVVPGLSALFSVTRVAKEGLGRLIADPDWLAPVSKAVTLLYKEASGDVARFKENIETWFDSSMDRVSGWYKRKTQLVHVLLALGFAVGLNVDSVLIVKRLSRDSALRKSVVAQAESFAKSPPVEINAATPPATGGTSAPAQQGGNADTSPQGKPTPTGDSLQLSSSSVPGGSSLLGTLTLSQAPDNELKVTVATSNKDQVPEPTPFTVEKGKTTRTFQIATKAVPITTSVTLKATYSGGSCEAALTLRPTPQEEYRVLREQLGQLELPVGWVSRPGDEAAKEGSGISDRDKGAKEEFRVWPGWHWGEGQGQAWLSLWEATIRFHFFGWLLTAAAASLGAPFWFDMLNKVITIRSTGKTPDEKEKEKEKQKPQK